MEKIVKIKGLDCSACAVELEEQLIKIKGIEESSVSFVSQIVLLEYKNEEALNKALHCISTFEDVEIVESDEEIHLEDHHEGHEHHEEGCGCGHHHEHHEEGCGCGHEHGHDHSGNKFEYEIVVDDKETRKLLKEEVKKIYGVKDVHIHGTKLEVFADSLDEKVLRAVSLNVKGVAFKEKEVKKETNPYKVDIICLIVAAILFGGGLVLEILKMNGILDGSWFKLYAVLYLIAYFVCGYKVMIKTVNNVKKGNIFDENFLMVIASVAALVFAFMPYFAKNETLRNIDMEMFEGVAVMLLYQLGETLQALAVHSSRKDISSLMELNADVALLEKDEKQYYVAVDALNIDDVIVLRNGDKVPVDCILLSNEGEFDTKSLTGEALAKEIKVGENVLSGYINVGSVLKLRVVKKYADSTVKRILSLMETSTLRKAKSEKFISKFAHVYTPIVCLIAVLIATIIPLILGLVNKGNYSYFFIDFIIRALKILVISCPCALVISVPLTYFASLGVASKNGILIKGATYLDILANANTIAYDKTGTLTKGKFKIVSSSNDEVLEIAAVAESMSTHPIAEAFANIKTSKKYTYINEIKARGIECIIDGVKYFVGNEKLLKEFNVPYEVVESLSVVIYVATEEKVLGYIEIDDVIKDDSAKTVKLLKDKKYKQVMLTGDSLSRAEFVNKALELDEIHGGLLPDEKLSLAEKLKANGGLVYVGDGINDAPVMACADVSMSLGRSSSTVAKEASDIVLLDSKLNNVYQTIVLAKNTHSIVIQNIVFSIAIKVIFMLLSIFFKELPLFIAVFADVGVMLLCVLNALRVKLSFRK